MSVAMSEVSAVLLVRWCSIIVLSFGIDLNVCVLGLGSGNLRLGLALAKMVLLTSPHDGDSEDNSDVVFVVDWRCEASSACLVWHGLVHSIAVQAGHRLRTSPCPGLCHPASCILLPGSPDDWRYYREAATLKIDCLQWEEIGINFLMQP